LTSRIASVSTRTRTCGEKFARDVRKVGSTATWDLMERSETTASDSWDDKHRGSCNQFGGRPFPATCRSVLLAIGCIDDHPLGVGHTPTRTTRHGDERTRPKATAPGRPTGRRCPQWWADRGVGCGSASGSQAGRRSWSTPRSCRPPSPVFYPQLRKPFALQDLRLVFWCTPRRRNSRSLQGL
jgi:hypothetical protein